MRIQKPEFGKCLVGHSIDQSFATVDTYYVPVALQWLHIFFFGRFVGCNGMHNVPDTIYSLRFKLFGTVDFLAYV